jgi:putative PEP-CTERM system histidine kinase
VNLATLSYGLTAALFVAATPLVAQVTTGTARRRSCAGMLLAMGAWAALLAADAAGWPVSLWAVLALDALRYAAAIGLLVSLGTLPLSTWVARGALALCAVVLLLAVAAQVLAGLAGGAAGLDRLAGLATLLLTVMGLILVEQVLRNSPTVGAGGLKLCALAIGGGFAFDLFVQMQATLPSGVDQLVWATRGVVYVLLLPFLLLGLRRMESQPSRAFVSRQVVFYGSAALAVGLYLVLASVVAYLLQTHGGSWSEPLRLVLLAGAVGVLAVVLLSDSPSRRLRVFIAKHFYSNKFDYRVEWLRFIATLSEPAAPGQDARHTAIRAIAQIFASPGGALYLRDEASGHFEPQATWFARATRVQLDPLPPDDDLLGFLVSTEWVVDLAEYQTMPERYRLIRMPACFTDPYGHWRIITPLFELEQLVGLLVLQSPPEPFQMNFEDRDLLKTVGRHVATLLAQQQADRKLGESRQFDAFNRFAAFVMHDLKNSVAQLQLLVSNAAKHRHNPEFVDDAIDTIANTVERMTRLIDQLQSREAHSSERRVDLAAVLQGAVTRSEVRAPAPQVLVDAHDYTVIADPDRLAAVFDHIIRNAQDAAGSTGEVRVTLSGTAGLCEVQIADNGPGMAPEFIRDRLFKPFDSTKGSKGMGIGAYQARAYVQQQRGSIEVQSSPAQGTRFTIRLPLCQTINSDY